MTAWNSVRGKVMRATKVDSCGKPVAGACSTIVTDGFITVSFSPQVEEGEEILVRKANGAICVSDRSADTLKRINVSINFCQVDPELFGLITANDVVNDYSGEAVGFRLSDAIQSDGGFALEVWSDVPGAKCGSTGLSQYGYFLMPYLSGGSMSDFTIENNAATFTYTSYSKSGEGWGTGPYNVDPTNNSNVAGPLRTPISSGEHLDMHLTTIAPPALSNGCATLTLPARYTTDTDADGTPDAYDATP